MKFHSLFGRTSQLQRALMLSMGVAVLGAACGEDGADDEALGGDAGLLAPSGEGGSVVPEAGLVLVDGSYVTPLDGSASGGGDGGNGTGGGNVDTAWCKAKPVLDKYCVSCHDGQGTGGSPMGLTKFSDYAANSAAFPGTPIFKRVKERMNASVKPMPASGKIPAAELALVNAWVDSGGGDNGNPTCSGGTGTTGDGGVTTPPGEWPKECEKFWKIQMHAPNSPGKPFNVPANYEDHPHAIFDAPWGDEDVQAIAFKPIVTNKKVLHHWILYQNSGVIPGIRPFLTGWAPGQENSQDQLPSDVGMFLPKGKQSLYLDMHYYNKNAGSVPETDASGVEICTVSKANFRPKMATVTMNFQVGLDYPLPVLAPKNRTGYRATRTCEVRSATPVTVLTASPHAHKLAKSMDFSVTKKNGTVISMHKGPYDFEEQHSYPLTPSVTLEAGDKVTTVCVYDNNTNTDIRFGEDTNQEMCFNFAIYYPMSANFICL